MLRIILLLMLTGLSFRPLTLLLLDFLHSLDRYPVNVSAMAYLLIHWNMELKPLHCNAIITKEIYCISISHDLSIVMSRESLYRKNILLILNLNNKVLSLWHNLIRDYIIVHCAQCAVIYIWQN